MSELDPVKVKARADSLWRVEQKLAVQEINEQNNAKSGAMDYALDLPRGVVQGVGRFGGSVFDLASKVSGGEGWDMDDTNPRVTRTWVGGVSSSVSQFLAGYALPGGAAGQAAKAFNAGRKAKIGLTMGAGAVADFVAFNGDEGRLADLLEKVPVLNKIVPDYLSSNPGDHWAEKRFKNALEGVGLGVVTESLLAAFKGSRAVKALTREDITGAEREIAERELHQAQKALPFASQALNDKVRVNELVESMAERADLPAEMLTGASYNVGQVQKLLNADLHDIKLLERGGVLTRGEDGRYRFSQTAGEVVVPGQFLDLKDGVVNRTQVGLKVTAPGAVETKAKGFWDSTNGEGRARALGVEEFSGKTPWEQLTTEQKTTFAKAVGAIKEGAQHETDFVGAFGTAKGAATDGYIDSMWKRVTENQPIPRMGALENKLRDMQKRGELRAREDVAAVVKATETGAASIQAVVKPPITDPIPDALKQKILKDIRSRVAKGEDIDAVAWDAVQTHLNIPRTGETTDVEGVLKRITEIMDDFTQAEKGGVRSYAKTKDLTREYLELHGQRGTLADELVQQAENAKELEARLLAGRVYRNKLGEDISGLVRIARQGGPAERGAAMKNLIGVVSEFNKVHYATDMIQTAGGRMVSQGNIVASKVNWSRMSKAVADFIKDCAL